MKKWLLLSLFIGLLALPLMYISESSKGIKYNIPYNVIDIAISKYGTIIIFGSVMQIIIILAILQALTR